MHLLLELYLILPQSRSYGERSTRRQELLPTVRPFLLSESAPPHATHLVLADHFDTAEYVDRLEQEGLTRKQAEGVIDTLEEIVEESIKNMQANLVTRAEQDKVRASIKRVQTDHWYCGG